MDSSTLTSNIIYGLLFVISGIIISVSLKRAGMKLAGRLFKILFGVILVYLPFYFGGTFFLEVTSKIIKNDICNIYFRNFMTQILSSQFPLFKSVSIITAVIAIFVAAGTIIALVSIVSKLLSIICKHWRELKCLTLLTNLNKPVTVNGYVDQSNIYKLTNHFLN